jgi:hypothetical protein
MHESSDTLAVLGYHYNDPFATSLTLARIGFYGVTGYPTSWWDGTVKRVGGNSNPNDPSMYSWFRGTFNQRKIVASPFIIEVGGSYASDVNQGTVNVRIKNVGANTIDGVLQVVIMETDMAYPWKTLDSLWDVVRDMLPDENGEAISVPSQGVVDKSRDFTISSDWDETKCQVVVFIQKPLAPVQVYQGAKSRITELKPLAVVEVPKPLPTTEVTVSPNPFNTLTTVRYFLPDAQKVEAKIYDATGKVVTTVINDVRPAGSNQITFNGESLPPGVYFLSLVTAKENIVKKLTVVK